jgi:hypothetical protein
MNRAGIQFGIVFAVLAATAGTVPSGGEAEGARDGVRAPSGAHVLRSAARPPARHTATVAETSRPLAASSSWWGDTFVASTGEWVNIVFADAYAQDSSLGRSWAELFASLVHGDELRALRVYIAPLDWVQEICGDGAFGCYGGNELVTIGTPAEGVAPWEVAAHEYGHHVAANRSNLPWSAVDWGTKRWASYVNICSRAAAGTVFPGDEGSRYRLNPGEGFAEAYRVLNERKRGGGAFSWATVDGSFIPDHRALALIEQDVRQPWQASALRSVTLSARTSRSRRVPLATPLDGALDVRLNLAPTASYDMTLLDGKRVLARGLWSSARVKSLQYTVCGERTLTLRLVRKSGPPRFVLRVATP